MKYKIGNIELGNEPGFLVENVAKLHEVINDFKFDGTMLNVPSMFSFPSSMSPITNQLLKGFFKTSRELPTPWKMIYDANVDFCKNVKDIFDPKCCMVAFSGGRDSTAAAIRMKNAGYRVSLFHVYGANGQKNKRETRCAVKLAKLMGMKLVMTEIRFKLKRPFGESPLKNQLIFSMMVEHGLENGISNFSAGNDLDTCSISPWKDGYSDGIEMFKAADVFFKFYEKSYKRHLVLRHDTESHFILTTYAPKLLDEISSCIASDEECIIKRKQNQEKYEIWIPNNRCGSCYKCAREYLVRILTLSDLSTPSLRYSKRCREILYNMLRWEGRVGDPVATFIDIKLCQDFRDRTWEPLKIAAPR